MQSERYAIDFLFCQYSNFVLKRENNPNYIFDPELVAMPGTRTTAASNVSPLLLFLRTRFNQADRPTMGTLMNVSVPTLLSCYASHTTSCKVLDLRMHPNIYQQHLGHWCFSIPN
jgi:hypothetical protein